MNDTLTDHPAIELLRCSARWRLIALLLEPPADLWQTDVAALAREVDDSELIQAAQAARHEASEPLYHTTLGPGGPAAPREVSHRGSILPGQYLGELLATYEAFGFQPSLPEAPDHVAVEVSFVGYLYFKQAYALLDGDDDRAAITAGVRDRFTREHLAPVAQPLAQALLQSGISYLATASAVLARLVGPPPAPSPSAGPLLPILDDEMVECGKPNEQS